MGRESNHLPFEEHPLATESTRFSDGTEGLSGAPRSPNASAPPRAPFPAECYGGGERDETLLSSSIGP